MDEALIAEQDDFHFLVGIGVGLPIVARYVVLEQASAPDGEVHFVARRSDPIRPGLVEGCVLLAPVCPLTGVSVQAADACRRRHPDVLIDDSDAITNVVQKAAGEVSEVLKLAAGKVTDSAKGSNPQV